jgi:hypothetical protein
VVLLFAGSFVAASLSGYRQRITRARPCSPRSSSSSRSSPSAPPRSAQPLPRTIVFAVPLFEAIALPLWRMLLRRAIPVRPRRTVLVGDERDISACRAARLARHARARHRLGVAQLEQPSIRGCVRDSRR